MQRRKFVEFLAAAGTAAFLPPVAEGATRPGFVPAGRRLGFTPVAVPLPAAPDFKQLRRFEVKDTLSVPPEYRYEVVCAWGDRLFADPADHFGYNNDFTAFIALKPDQSEGLLWVNHEYISEKPWVDTYKTVIGKVLPAETVLREQNGQILEADAHTLARLLLYDQGGSIVHLRRDKSGRYQPVSGSNFNRRISGIAGLDNPAQLLDSDGPAAEVFGRGKDGLGRKIVGTFANCSGGVTPWETVLSCEENFQSQVGDGVDANGQPLATGATLSLESFPNFAGTTLGLAGNKYGWVVEVDPRDPQSTAVKHTALGRFRHENVAIRAIEGKPLVCYMGDDRTGGHTWKYVSRNVYLAARGKANSALLADGTLYVARYHEDGTGEWVPLALTTPVAPIDPGRLAGGRLLLPARPAGGSQPVDSREAVAEYRSRYKTLADLYTSRGAVLIDAFLAANAVGGTPTARPEDLEIHPMDGSVFIAYTSGATTAEGGPDAQIFVTGFKSTERTDRPPHGAVYRLFEQDGDPAARRFRWQAFAHSGEIAAGGAGFANPDNLCFDAQANLWICSDIGNQNQPVPSRANARESATVGLFGSNTLWYMPTTGNRAGIAFPFATGPIDCELTGPTFTADGRTLFLSVQHPGEGGGWRRAGAFRPETEYELLSADGKRTFIQTRRIPTGSNFPSGKQGPPKPCVVAIHRRQK